MRRLNNETYHAITGESRVPRKEKVLQFGEGGFLRAFVDEMFDQLNNAGLFDGGVTVVQPIERGMVPVLNEQDGLYTLLLRGLEEGVPVSRERVIRIIQRGVNPYTDYETYIASAQNPDLRFVVSNTTEAGIAYNGEDRLSDRPPKSFPGKVTAFLWERFTFFKGAKDKGLVFLPCELIDDNGAELRKIVLRLCAEWQLGPDFTRWVEESCIFTSTLVDRVVTGYPKDEAAAICERLGYEDSMLDTGEVFHFWAIEGPECLAEELPFQKLGLNVLFAEDISAYKRRKVRILNGAHSSLTPVALLCGLSTVGEVMEDADLRRYVERVLYEEVIPTLDLPREDLLSFAKAVLDRFANPYIHHQLTSIALNSTSKWRVRVLPSVEAYLKEKGKLPPLLTFSFAALLALMEEHRPDIEDCDNVQDLFAELASIPGFKDTVDADREDIKREGCRAALAKRLG